MSLTRRICLRWGGKLSRIKRKSNKKNVKIENLVEISRKAAEKGEFVKINDPFHELDDLLDDLPVDAVIELKW